MKSSILVVGGAGYIGSHMAKMLAQSSHEVIVMDNLSTGFRDAARYGRLIEGDLADQALLDRIFAEDDIAAVLHFAALSQVGESMREPARYYRNNVANTQNLLDAMLRHHVRASSSPLPRRYLASQKALSSMSNIPSAPSIPTVAANAWWKKCWRITTALTGCAP